MVNWTALLGLEQGVKVRHTTTSWIVHVETLYGENAHHIAESSFKGLARALRAAVALDPRQKGAIPSTKGLLSC